MIASECPTEPFKCLCALHSSIFIHTDIFASLLLMNYELLHMKINVLNMFFHAFAFLNEVSEANPDNYIQINTGAHSRIKTTPAKANG